MNKQRTSFSIQNAGDKEALIRFLKDLRPTTIGVMDDAQLLRRIMNEVPGIYVGWFRPYRQDDGKFWQLGQEPIDWLIDQWNASGLRSVPNTYLSVMCEPAADSANDISRLVNWTVTAMSQLKKQGIRAVVLNAQPSVFRYEFVQAGLFDPLLRELADGYHILGWHEYGGAIPPKGAYGGNKYDMLRKQLVQPAGWPTRAQVKGPPNEGNWLIGRLYWWDARAHRIGVKIPTKIITEAGQDAQGVYSDIDAELRDRYGIPHPHHAMRGWNTYRNVYNDYYGGTYPEPVGDYTQFAFMKWYDEIYDETVLGINYFIWSPGAYDWDTQFGFDYSKAASLQWLLLEHTKRLEREAPPPEPKPEPPPIPPDTTRVSIKKTDLQTMVDNLNQISRDLIAVVPILQRWISSGS